MITKLKNLHLISARKNKGLTQEQLAELLECKKATISNWENGYSMPRLVDAIGLSIVLEKNIDEIFFEEKVQVSYTMSKKLKKNTTDNNPVVSKIS